MLINFLINFFNLWMQWTLVQQTTDQIRNCWFHLFIIKIYGYTQRTHAACSHDWEFSAQNIRTKKTLMTLQMPQDHCYFMKCGIYRIHNCRHPNAWHKKRFHVWSFLQLLVHFYSHFYVRAQQWPSNDLCAVHHSNTVMSWADVFTFIYLALGKYAPQPRT